MVSDASFVEFARSRKTDRIVGEHLFQRQGGLAGGLRSLFSEVGSCCRIDETAKECSVNQGELWTEAFRGSLWSTWWCQKSDCGSSAGHIFEK